MPLMVGFEVGVANVGSAIVTSAPLVTFASITVTAPLDVLPDGSIAFCTWLPSGSIHAVSV